MFADLEPPTLMTIVWQRTICKLLLLLAHGWGRLILACFLWVCGVGGVSAKAQHEQALPVMALSDLEQTQALPSVAFLYDELEQYEASELAHPERSNLFKKDATTSMLLYSSGALWVRFSIVNDQNASAEIALYALPTHFVFDVHELDADGGLISSTQAGAVVRIAEREVHSRYPATYVTLAPKEHKQFLVQMKSNDILKPQVMYAEKEHFTRQDSTKNAIVPIYYGLMLALIIYNLFLFFTIRDRSYLYYILFAASFTLLLGCVDGFADIYLGQGNFGSWTRFYPPIHTATILFVNIFVINLLEYARKERHTYRLVFGINVILVLILGVQIFASIRLQTYVDAVTVALACVHLMIGIKQWLRGSKPAKYFSIAWSSLMLTASFAVIVPHLGDIKQETLYSALYVGSALQALLMSFALGSRITVLETEKLEATVKAQEAEKLQNLVRILCHDLSTPLAIIKAHAQWVIDHANSAADTTFVRWQKVNKAVGVTSDILSNVKYMESLRSGKMLLTLAPVSLKEAIEHAQFVFDKELAHKELRIVSPFLCDEGRDVFVHTEKVSFYNQVIGNIISNAIKFSYHGQSIEVTAREEKEWCILEIRDFGTGMSEEVKESIFSFDKKTTSLGTQGEVGTGFGLPIVKSFVEMCGGKVEVESRQKLTNAVDHGTTFRLFLRRAA